MNVIPMRVTRTRRVGFRLNQENVYMFREIRVDGMREMSGLIPHIKPMKALRLVSGAR